jgi:hypothetical protein
LRKISDAVNLTFANPTQSEPQLIANLVWHLPTHLNTVALSGGYSFKTGGVFVHAQPFVQCRNFPRSIPASVEIGDLLLLRTAVHNGAICDRRAMLLQAKKVNSLPATPDNENQHRLYAQWPAFKYVRSTPALNGKKRHIRGSDLYDASKYFLILQGGCNFCFTMAHNLFPGFFCKNSVSLMTAHPTEPNLSHYRCFVHEIVDFIIGDTGKQYINPPPARSKNWDRVIEDLTTITANLNSRYIQRTFFGVSTLRGQMLGLHFCSGVVPKYSKLSDVGISMEGRFNRLDGPPEVPSEWSEKEDEGGISIIEFVVSSEG